VEETVGKLAVAFVGVEERHPELDENSANEILNWLQDSPTFTNRFGLSSVRTDLVLDAILKEYELGPLSGSDGQQRRFELQQADVLIGTQISGSNDDVQIILRGYSVSRQKLITERVEVAGPFDSAKDLASQLRPMIETLATRLAQEFPRLRAPAIELDGARVAFELTSRDGIKEFYNCIFVERVEEVVGIKKYVSEKWETRGEGFCETPRSRDFSWGEFTLDEATLALPNPGPIDGPFFVIIK
jgi:hypothetical protein